VRHPADKSLRAPAEKSIRGRPELQRPTPENGNTRPPEAERFFDFASRPKIERRDFRKRDRDAALRMTSWAENSESGAAQALEQMPG
jgi:hypothetical protein